MICRLRPLWPSVVFVLKLLEPLLGLDSEQSVFLALGVKRSMVEGLAYGFPLFEKSRCGIGEICGGHALEDVVHGLVGRVEHVGLVEAVVAKLVVDNLE